MAEEENISSGPMDGGFVSTAEPNSWQEWLEQNVLLWAANDPWGFLKTIFLFMSPLFILSGILSYILLKDIEKRDKDKKRKSKKDTNTLRVRGKVIKPKHRKAD